MRSLTLPPLPGGARGWVGLAGVGAALLLALALSPGGLAPAAARAALAAAALAALAAWARRRGAVRAAPRLVVVARQPLGRDAGIALAELDGRPLLLGFGSGGVRLLQATEVARRGLAAAGPRSKDTPEALT